MRFFFFEIRRIMCSGARFSKVPRTFRARKAIRKTTTCLFCKAGLLICCKGNKNKNNCKVSFLETPSFWRYKENYDTRNTPEKFRHFRETGPRAELCDFALTHNSGNPVLSWDHAFRWRLTNSAFIPWLKKIIWVIGVLRRTVVSDWRFDNLCGSHLQSQVTRKMASAQVVETSVTNNSPSQDSYHPDDLLQSRYATPGFRPFS